MLRTTPFMNNICCQLFKCFCFLSDILRPTSARVNVERMHVTDNPKIPKQVDRIVCDELKAVEAAHGLYELGLDVYKVTTILSSGALGLRGAQKMVPTLITHVI
jgi:hypothetical protein